MITRIVKLSFEPDQIGTFLDLFAQHALNMQDVAGCVSLQLLRDEKEEHLFFTVSVWRENYYLEQYRQSELFKSTWYKVKLLFRDRPQAWTTQVIYDGKN